MDGKKKSNCRRDRVRINIPVSLIRRLRSDRTSVEMLVCAVMIKREYQNSVLYGLTPYRVSKFFHVSYAKARKLIVAFKESDLFTYNEEKDTLFAKSFKSREKVVYGWRGTNKYEAFADYCYKMQMSGEINLRYAVRELRKILILNVINAVERTRGDDFKSLHSGSNRVTKLPKSSAIPQRQLGVSIGMSRSSAARYVNELVSDGRVSKTQMVAECVIPALNDDTAQSFMKAHPGKGFFALHDTAHGGWSGWTMYGYAYSICNRKDSDAFQHVIWNYAADRRKGNRAID